MTRSFAPRLGILPVPRRRLWEELVSVPAEFVLHGVTAVALHLAHREPIGFGFFGDGDFDPLRLAASIDAILQDRRIDLPMMLMGARAICGPHFNPQITLKALSVFEDGNLPRAPRAMRRRLAMAVQDVDLDRLPEVPQR